MFIAHFKDGETITEENATWDDIPHDKGITSLEITFPVNLFETQNGAPKHIPAPKITIANYDRYYCANIAVMTILKTVDGKVEGPSAPQVVGKVMAGIDFEHKFVLQVKMDRLGNTEVKRYMLDTWLKEFGIRQTTFKRGA